MLIRLIDVVLILLFGFIAISEVTFRSEIDLPDSSTAPLSTPDAEEVIFIGIRKDGTYLAENETLVIEKIPELRSYLKEKLAQFRSKNIRIRVRFRSAWNAPIYYMMAGADICDELGISKSMDVERK